MYNHVGSSGDGTILLTSPHVGSDGLGPIDVSTNGGMSWTSFAPPLPPPEAFMRSNWNGVACSSDGSTLLAASLNGPISVSTNQGVTWQESNLVDSFQGVACSADGKRLVVVAAHQPSPPLTTSGIYLSSDGGNTWTQANLPSLMWFSAASSADGTTIAAGGPYVYVSTNSGTNWNPTGLPIANYFGLACSADGTKMIAGSASYSTGAVFTSSDSGVTWTPAPLTNLNYFSVFSLS